jgi:hypothetical protein
MKHQIAKDIQPKSRKKYKRNRAVAVPDQHNNAIEKSICHLVIRQRSVRNS